MGVRAYKWMLLEPNKAKTTAFADLTVYNRCLPGNILEAALKKWVAI